MTNVHRRSIRKTGGSKYHISLHRHAPCPPQFIHDGPLCDFQTNHYDNATMNWLKPSVLWTPHWYSHHYKTYN